MWKLKWNPCLSTAIISLTNNTQKSKGSESQESKNKSQSQERFILIPGSCFLALFYSFVAG